MSRVKELIGENGMLRRDLEVIFKLIVIEDEVANDVADISL